MERLLHAQQHQLCHFGIVPCSVQAGFFIAFDQAALGEQLTEHHGAACLFWLDCECCYPFEAVSAHGNRRWRTCGLLCCGFIQHVSQRNGLHVCLRINPFFQRWGVCDQKANAAAQRLGG